MTLRRLSPSAPCCGAFHQTAAQLRKTGAPMHFDRVVGLNRCRIVARAAANTADVTQTGAKSATLDFGDEARILLRKRRRRQIALLWFGLPFFVVLCLFFKAFPAQFNHLSAGIAAIVAIAYVIFAVIFSWRNWRCPRCNRWLGRNLSPRACSRCGTMILRSQNQPRNPPLGNPRGMPRTLLQLENGVRIRDGRAGAGFGRTGCLCS